MTGLITAAAGPVCVAMSEALATPDYPMPTAFTPKVQPVVSWQVCGKFGLRSIVLEDAGDCVPQHAHDDGHITLIGSGRARGWRNGKCIGEFGPGEAVETLAGIDHLFQALEPKTRFTCISVVPVEDRDPPKGE